MSTEVKVDLNGLEDIARQIANLSLQLNDIFDEIKSNGKGVISKEIWSGQSAEFFSSKMKGLTEKFEDIYTEMDNSATYLINITNYYKTNRNRYLKMF